jgi:hypothetical protein
MLRDGTQVLADWSFEQHDGTIPKKNAVSFKTAGKTVQADAVFVLGMFVLIE